MLLRIAVPLSHIDDLPLAQVYLIAGPAASGKTTFATKLATHLQAAVLSMDHYFVDEQAVVIEYDEKYGDAPQWESPEAYDLQTLEQNIKELLQAGKTFIPQYSFVANRRVGYQLMTLKAQQPLILEGLYTIRWQIFFAQHAQSSVKIFVIADSAIRQTRARIRDVEERGKPLEAFESRRHFVELGEQRWGLSQAQEADFILEIHDTFSYAAFFDHTRIR